MTAPAKKSAAKKPAAKRSPRAAKPAEQVEPELPELSELSEEELAALAADPAEDTDKGPIGSDGEIRPVKIGKRGRKGAPEVEMTTIFEIDDVPFQIPKNPSPALVLRWMHDMRKHGQLVAVEKMCFTLLGDEAMDALASDPEVEAEDVANVFTIVGHIFFESSTYKKLMASANPS